MVPLPSPFLMLENVYYIRVLCLYTYSFERYCGHILPPSGNICKYSLVLATGRDLSLLSQKPIHLYPSTLLFNSLTES